jgi:hypothetical protein
MSNSIIVFFIRCLIYVPLFNFNVIVLVCDKEDAAQLFNSYLLRDIKHVV